MIEFEVSLLDTTYRGTINTTNKGQKVMGLNKLENETVDKATYSGIVALLGSKKYKAIQNIIKLVIPMYHQVYVPHFDNT